MKLPSDQDHTGRSFGAEEARLLAEVLEGGTLTSTRGTMVRRFEAAFARRMGRAFAVACASGSAAVHCAVAALRPGAGDEVITTPITDMGAITPILYQGAVPVFADVDPATLNVTADTIAARITDRTRAIVVTHLFGRTCDMGPIRDLARRRGLPIVEDAAQAFLAEDRTGMAGAHGALCCYSLQQGKHMTCGEGGVVTADDPALARAVTLFVNKGWGYGDVRPDHGIPALNYRLTELQAAVALGQLGKLDRAVAARRLAAAALTGLLHAVPGLELPGDPPGGAHSFWRYAFLVDPAQVPGGAAALGARMQARGVACAPRYVQKPAFECALFANWRAFPVMALPLGSNPRGALPGPLFARADYPGACRALERVVVLPINERYEAPHVAFVADVIREEVARLRAEPARTPGAPLRETLREHG